MGCKSTSTRVGGGSGIHGDTGAQGDYTCTDSVSHIPWGMGAGWGTITIKIQEVTCWSHGDVGRNQIKIQQVAFSVGFMGYVG